MGRKRTRKKPKEIRRFGIGKKNGIIHRRKEIGKKSKGK